ncbi:MAG: hypothetical protein OXF85_00335 [Candidatus Saccharibacteria bacterium]|nr:hypothetical protein [Candidatus Saccharibacteria bacterium]
MPWFSQQSREPIAQGSWQINQVIPWSVIEIESIGHIVGYSFGSVLGNSLNQIILRITLISIVDIDFCLRGAGRRLNRTAVC